ncbi:MAG: hypothetical protein H0Z35_03855 [Thermoanaerobacteraceae bacterium]|nr:hypothetical protein [Thermoanaerobacteraceae bacterium]
MATFSCILPTVAQDLSSSEPFITTLVAIGLGIKYQPRARCQICPMGTLSTMAARKHLENNKTSR